MIPPSEVRARPAGADAVSEEALDQLAALLDDVFRLPGTRIRFGLDPLIGLVPGLGDLLMAFTSSFIVYSAWQMGTPRVTVLRMLVNLAIDAAVGAVPLAGDAFDVAWKANRRNVELLKRTRREPGRTQSWRDWLFLAAVLAMVLALAALPLLVLYWLVTALRS